MESLSALVVRTQSADKEAEQELYERLRPYVRMLAGSRDFLPAGAHGHVDGSDLTQATLLRVAKSIPDYRGSCDRQFKAWIRQILQRQAIDLLRQQPPERPLDQSGPGGPLRNQLADDGSTPSGKLMRRERELRLLEALEQLPDDQKLAVGLRHLKKLPIEEIARQLGDRTPGATSALIYRGMNRLHELLKDLE
ncbi:MAG: sigma-70 family RNA polymerase sigma factor [Planctomycetaceae bacterium]